MMRAALLATAIVSGLLFGTTAGALAEADGPDYFRVTGVAKNDVLNIRSEPRAGAEKLGEIPWDGDGIRNLGCEGGLSFAEWEEATEAERKAGAQTRWCRISYQGVEGWAAGWFLVEGAYPAADKENSANLVVSRFAAVDGETAIGETEITFGPDGSLSGSTGCNRFQGRGMMQNARLAIDGPLVKTRMACPGDALADVAPLSCP